MILLHVLRSVQVGHIKRSHVQYVWKWTQYQALCNVTTEPRAANPVLHSQSHRGGACLGRGYRFVLSNHGRLIQHHLPANALARVSLRVNYSWWGERKCLESEYWSSSEDSRCYQDLYRLFLNLRTSSGNIKAVLLVKHIWGELVGFWLLSCLSVALSLTLACYLGLSLRQCTNCQHRFIYLPHDVAII